MVLYEMIGWEVSFTLLHERTNLESLRTRLSQSCLHWVPLRYTLSPVQSAVRNCINETHLFPSVQVQVIHINGQNWYTKPLGLTVVKVMGMGL